MLRCMQKDKSILRSPKVKLNFEILLFKNVSRYYCKSRLLTGAFFDKPDIFGKILIHLPGQPPLRETIRECHLKLTDHCIRIPTDEEREIIILLKNRKSFNSNPTLFHSYTSLINELHVWKKDRLLFPRLRYK